MVKPRFETDDETQNFLEVPDFKDPENYDAFEAYVMGIVEDYKRYADARMDELKSKVGDQRCFMRQGDAMELVMLVNGKTICQKVEDLLLDLCSMIGVELLDGYERTVGEIKSLVGNLIVGNKNDENIGDDEDLLALQRKRFQEMASKGIFTDK